MVERGTKPMDNRPRPPGDGERVRYGGAVVEQQILTPDEEGRVSEGEWQETEFHPSKYENYIEGRKESDDHFLLAKFEATKDQSGKREKRPSLGIALRVDPWRQTVNDRSPIIGVVVREVYAKRGTRTDMRPGDVLLVDDNGEIAPRTQAGKEVPAIFRNEENKAKISFLFAQREQKISNPRISKKPRRPDREAA